VLGAIRDEHLILGVHVPKLTACGRRRHPQTVLGSVGGLHRPSAARRDESRLIRGIPMQCRQVAVRAQGPAPDAPLGDLRRKHEDWYG
jgi:hypothetical protein